MNPSHANTIALVEDTPDTLEVIRHFLKKHHPDLHIVGEAQTVAGACTLLTTTRPDIVLLDVNIIGGTSFDVLARLTGAGVPLPQLIFVTAHGERENVLRALRYAALDFITKTIDEQQLRQAIDRAIDRVNTHETLIEGVRSMLEQQRRGDPFDQVVIRLVAGVRRLVNVRELVYFEAQREMTDVYLANGERLAAAINIGHFTRMLRDDHDFLLIHQSCLVNSQFIESFNPAKGEVLLITGQRLSTSKTGNTLVRSYTQRRETRQPSTGILSALRHYFRRGKQD